MRMLVGDRMLVPEWAVSDRRYAACLWLLELLWGDRRVTGRVTVDADAGVLSIDVYGLLEEPSWSSAERLVVHAALGLYGAVPDGDQLGLLVEVLDDVTFARLIEAIEIRRGVRRLEARRLPAVSDRAEELRARIAVEREVLAVHRRERYAEPVVAGRSRVWQ